MGGAESRAWKSHLQLAAACSDVSILVQLSEYNKTKITTDQLQPDCYSHISRSRLREKYYSSFVMWTKLRPQYLTPSRTLRPASTQSLNRRSRPRKCTNLQKKSIPTFVARLTVAEVRAGGATWAALCSQTSNLRILDGHLHYAKCNKYNIGIDLDIRWVRWAL